MSDTPSSRPASATRLSLSHITAQHETNLLGTRRMREAGIRRSHRLARRAAIVASREAT
jgi:hypothetical protein